MLLLPLVAISTVVLVMVVVKLVCTVVQWWLGKRGFECLVGGLCVAPLALKAGESRSPLL